MTSTRIQFVIVLACLSSLSSIRTTRAAIEYTVTDIGTIPTGVDSSGLGINAAGQVTGYSTVNGLNHTHAFVYDGTLHDLGTFGGGLARGFSINSAGQVAGHSTSPITGDFRAIFYDGIAHDLGTFGGARSEALGLNDNGHVVGYADLTGNAHWHAFMYDGTLHDLGTLGGPGDSVAQAINNDGQITGYASLLGGSDHAFFYDGAMHDLGTLGGTFSIGIGINSAGHVAGFSMLPGNSNYHAFLYDGVMHDLGTLGGSDSQARGINSAGDVVGNANSLTFGHAALWKHGGEIVDLNSVIAPASGWELLSAAAINDVGQITGQGKINGEYHAFLLTPIPTPEPCAALLVIFGATIIANLRSIRSHTYRRNA
jgi:probable HAF family extracellular repeat protein